MALGMVMRAEQKFRRWRHQALFVRVEFKEPEQVYAPPASPPPRNDSAPRQEPPPRDEPPPQNKRADPSVAPVTGMQCESFLSSHEAGSKSTVRCRESRSIVDVRSV
jgi:hypothetical protein